ncbi:MAG TPA: tRNA lysidine(34) synthetase TilS [Limnobacter sp.]|uniref:tRNA lysidine(34) synthetase TilS n=1 Tax=Limnobacter sp. TaxID=2003368 RepID=UPI002ED7AD29
MSQAPSDTAHPVQQAVQRFFLLYGEQPALRERIAVAFSGGLDSTVLLHALHATGRPLQALHVNHGLQAAAQAWPGHCANVCNAWNIPFECLTVAVESTGLGLEADARQARYACLQAWMSAHGLPVLATAHHRDDQIETVLLQLFRGSGVKGLAGMRAYGPMGVNRIQAQGLSLIRPLLDCTREELESYAVQHRLTWIEDPSNADPSIRRNWVRRDLLPALRTHFPQVDHGVLQLARHIAEEVQAEAVAQQALVLTLCDASLQLKLAPWRQETQATRLAFLKHWLEQGGVRCGREPLIELERQLMATTHGGVRQVTSGWSVKVNRGLARVQRAA